MPTSLENALANQQVVNRPRHLVPKAELRRRPAWATMRHWGLTRDDKDRPMPPLIAFAGALGGLAVVRWAYKTAVRINRELEEARLARVAEAQTGDIPTLRRDPVTGLIGWVKRSRLATHRAVPYHRHRLDSTAPRRYGPALFNPPSRDRFCRWTHSLPICARNVRSRALSSPCTGFGRSRAA